MTIEKEIANFLLQFHNIKDHKHGISRHLILTFGQEKGTGKKTKIIQPFQKELIF